MVKTKILKWPKCSLKHISHQLPWNWACTEPKYPSLKWAVFFTKQVYSSPLSAVLSIISDILKWHVSRDFLQKLIYCNPLSTVLSITSDILKWPASRDFLQNQTTWISLGYTQVNKSTYVVSHNTKHVDSSSSSTKTKKRIHTTVWSSIMELGIHKTSSWKIKIKQKKLTLGSTRNG